MWRPSLRSRQFLVPKCCLTIIFGRKTNRFRHSHQYESSSNTMPNNETNYFPCNSARSISEDHNEFSLISLIGSSVRSSARPGARTPVASFRPTSSPGNTGCESLLEILTEAVELTCEDPYAIEDLFQLTDGEPPISSHGPKQ